jgi:hypothetical protein
VDLYLFFKFKTEVNIFFFFCKSLLIILLEIVESWLSKQKAFGIARKLVGNYIMKLTVHAKRERER